MEYTAKIFRHDTFGCLRVVTIDSDPYFVGKDVATALGYKNPREAVRMHIPDKFKRIEEIETRGGNQNIVLINQAGLYKLILRSTLPTADKFSDWLCEEVFPSVWSIGLYTMQQMLEQFLQSIVNAEPSLKCVYIHEMSNGRIKIGNTEDFLRRMRQIETASGYTVVRSYHTDYLLKKTAYSLERDCHESFADDRILGEYFSTPFEEACNELNRRIADKQD